MTLEITIRNMAGSVKKMFFIMVPSPNTPNILPSPTMEQFHATSSTTVMDMTASSIVGLIALFLFTIFLVLIIIILVRFRRREQEQKNIVKDEYRRVPLISVDPSLPRNICCHSLDSSSTFCSCQRNTQGLSMKTFGQDTQQDNSQGCTRSDTILSLASPSSVDTDMLSSLGVRMKEFPDPLAGWEDLEPELQARRRSSHAEDVFMR
eukprot:TRINITY_DN33724_c0_g1_i1.p1 TRINITY_DN33724_c0_g1~~TRINITY_DN33724_c0_g1_i1.p1  ORF type:complete len:237 (-),score=91.95 TRINITY_DN33724_c0_g1_i1:139-759(-)